MDKLLYKTTVELRDLYLKKQVSPVDVVDAMFKRVEATHPKYNFMASVNHEKTLRLAKQAETAYLSGGENIPYLTGIPVTIKDNIPLEGEPYTDGSYAYKDRIADHTALLAQRLLDAGAINVIKTTLPEFCHKMITDSPLFGYTRNPFNPDYSPGGSSGGAVTSLALGIGTMAIGSDGGGSIRCPASCTNVVGLKPTTGSIPAEDWNDTFGTYPMKGSIARTVTDCATLFSVMSGPNAADLWSHFDTKFPLKDALNLEGKVKGLKIAYIEKFGPGPIHEDVSKLCRKTLKYFSDAGAHVEEVPGDIFYHVGEFFIMTHTIGHAAHLGKYVKDYAEHMSLTLLDCIAQGKTYTAVEYQWAIDQRTLLWRNVEKIFTQYDVIISPTLSEPLQKVTSGAAMNSKLFTTWCPYLYPFNLTGNPALSVPVGLSQEGFPVGMQLVGPWFSEKRLFEIAKYIEDHQPWSQLYPKL